MELTVTFRNSFADVMELNWIAPEQRLKARILLSFALIFLTVGLILYFVAGSEKGLGIMFSSILFAILAVIATTVAGFGAWRRTPRGLQTLRFNENGVIACLDDKEATFEWGICGYFYKTPHLLVLRVAGPGGVFAIPKRVCLPELLSTLRGLLKSRLSTNPPSWVWYLT
jgi:hypothetical protein